MRITTTVSFFILLACGSPQRGESDSGTDAPQDTDAAADSIETAEDTPATTEDTQPADSAASLDTAPDTAVVGPDRLVLDPTTLSFFGLPIGSIRVAVSGLDPEANLCATIIFDYSNTDHELEAHCDGFGFHFPYVLVVPNGAESCVGAWDYSGDHEVTAVEGCFDTSGFVAPGLDLADLTLTVAGETFNGTIEVDNRSTFDPPPVSLGLVFTTDVPEDVWIQSQDAYGLPGWVEILRDGEPLPIHDRCDVPACDDPDAGVCGIAFQSVRSLTRGDYGGSAWLTWDGRVRVPSADGSCRRTEAAPPGDYVARFCFGWTTDEAPGGAGTIVTIPTCVEEPFSYPTPMVVHRADFGG